MHDLHIHTHHSCDSKTSLDSYCKKAVELGLEYICFTDHIDFNKADYGYGYYDASLFFKEFNPLKEKYVDNLTLLCGVEFSEPHVYPKEFEMYQKMPYDFILGSIHFWVDDLFPTKMKKSNISAKTAFNRYWQEVYAAVSFGGFDSLAHFDFPKRYYGELLYSEKSIISVCKKMIRNNIAMEINTSTLRQGLDCSMPDKALLDIYKQAGGRYVTFGSDAHSVQELGAGYQHARSLISGNLQNVIYVQRRPIKCSLM
ncbi:MAG: histidinol-phosphatase HisJ family protein [Clostridiales bacterium]|nr:histidinol-phosphatase HisJ family protein [Clostridiales bacterium]